MAPILQGSLWAVEPWVEPLGCQRKAEQGDDVLEINRQSTISVDSILMPTCSLQKLASLQLGVQQSHLLVDSSPLLTWMDLRSNK